MTSVIGETLPLALGIAISPIPITAAILMLLSPRARVTSVAFLIGWLAGIVVALVAFIALAAALPTSEPGRPQPVAAATRIALGILMLLLAGKQWKGRPRTGDDATLPTWMTAINGMNSGKCLGLGFLLSAVNPKNLLMAASAGFIIGAALLPAGLMIVVVIVFTVIAGSSVAIPVISYLAASRRMAAPLEALRGWLVQHNAAVMTVLLLVIGVTMIGKGMGSL